MNDDQLAVRAIAYYLPQYHPIPENDAWWGRGFTEWTNVVRAKPLFRGHQQPHLPTELGFYDLRLPEVRQAQADLAREYGLHGFCYYYYSFGEKRLLERPLLEVLESGKPDFPFCICWANETWSRRWDGSESEILVAQDDSVERYRHFIHEVLPILKDPRYIRVSGAPVLLVYRASRIPEVAQVVAYWRAQAAAAGLAGLYLCAVQSHDPTCDPRPIGFDAAVEFPPSPWHGMAIDPKTLPDLHTDFTGSVFDYGSFAARTLARSAPEYRLLRGVMTDWDNTARRGPAAYIFRNASPARYETWLRGAVSWTLAHNPPPERLVFVNAWNEWAEGAHLEPDEEHGRAWLEATRRSLSRSDAWRSALAALRHEGEQPLPELLRAYADDIRHALERLELGETASGWQTAFACGSPSGCEGKPLRQDGVVQIEALQGRPVCGRVELRAEGGRLDVVGWAIAPGMDLGTASGVLMLRSPTGARTYSASLGPRVIRHDVAYKHRHLDPRCVGQAGFSGSFQTDGVEPGEYRLMVLHVGAQEVLAARSEQRIILR